MSPGGSCTHISCCSTREGGPPGPGGVGLGRGAAWGGVRGSRSHKVLSESFRGSRAKGRSREQMMTALQRARSRWESGQGRPGGHWRVAGGSVTVAGDSAPSPPVRGRCRQRAALLAGGFPGPTRKTAPQQWGHPQAGRSAVEDQPPRSSRDRHAYWANRVLCLQSKEGHAGASFPQSSTPSFPTGPEQ